MNSPYMGKFRVSQEFRPPQNPSHDGLDLVGIDSKEIHATVNGTVHFAGWENPNNHAQGFGLYVCIKGCDGLFYYYGHLSELKVSSGQSVKCTDVVGIEGSTGHSTGSHCHYEIRKAFFKGAEVVNVSEKSGIPNSAGSTFDDGYRPSDEPIKSGTYSNIEVKALQTALKAHGYDCGAVDGIIGTNTIAAMVRALRDRWL